MPLQLLRPMQPVSLEVPEGTNAGTYASLVLDFVENEEITVGAPLERGREVRLDPQSQVRLQFSRPDGIHVLSTHVLGRTSNQPSLRLAWPDQIERLQRRSFVRVEVLVRSHIDMVDRDTGEDRRVSGLGTDLSAGGVRVTLPVALEPEHQVRVTLHLPGIGDLTCEALVARTGETSGAAPKHRYWAALEFTGLLESVRKELTQFVFDVQREQLRKGVI